jgi:AraC family transcriptional regulator, positive regulator of tynA and feaB
VARVIGNYPTGLGGRLLPETPLTSLLFTQLVQIADALPIMDDAAREVALTAATDFALATLRHVTRTEAWDDDAHLAGLWLAAERLIERHLGCTDLNPDFLAHALHCSRTHLYRVFAQHGTAVMDHIREIRLHRSRDMLADPSCQLQVAEIASLCGMDNPSAFSRSFRLRFGCAPADIRRQARLGIVGD